MYPSVDTPPATAPTPCTYVVWALRSLVVQPLHDLSARDALSGTVTPFTPCQAARRWPSKCWTSSLVTGGNDS